MKKSYLKNTPIKYIRFEVEEDIAKKDLDNFENLLKYIGNNIDFGRDNYAGNAYLAIIRRTNEILGLQNPRINRLRTTKSEVKSIRLCSEKKILKNGKYIMKIPFKVSYIFEAIISLINDITKDTPIPHDLIPFIGLSYGIAFYSKYISEYRDHYEEVKEDFNKNPFSASCKCKIELKNDFTSMDSPFIVIFQG